MDGVEVGPLLGQHAGKEAEVVVLHEHRGTLGRRRVHDLREQLVELAVRLPGGGEVVVEAGRRARSKRWWCKNHNVEFDTTS